MPLQLGVELFENGLGKASADVAHGFEDLLGGVVAAEEERTVDTRAFSLAEVSAQHDQVERVADSGKVVLFHFEPVATALAWFITRFGGVKHLHHESFTG